MLMIFFSAISSLFGFAFFLRAEMLVLSVQNRMKTSTKDGKKYVKVKA